MLGEVDGGRALDAAVLEEVVEGRGALEALQAVDHGEAAIVADDDDELKAGEDRAVDVGVEHQVAAVADEDDHVARGVGHLRPPAAGDLVAHAGEAELAVEAADRLGLPVLAQLARQAAGCGQRQIARVAHAVDGADHVGIGRQLGVGGGRSADRSACSRPHIPRARDRSTARPLPGAERCAHLLEAGLGVAHDRQGLMLVGIEARRVEADEARRRRRTPTRSRW